MKPSFCPRLELNGILLKENYPGQEISIFTSVYPVLKVKKKMHKDIFKWIDNYECSLIYVYITLS